MTKRIPEKVIRNGKVAVLVSPGYGAGWSTWASDYAEFCVFDKHFVEAKENGVDREGLDKIIEFELGIKDHIYTGGWDDVEIEWLEQGTPFCIEEYDGSESLRTYDDFRYCA